MGSTNSSLVFNPWEKWEHLFLHQKEDCFMLHLLPFCFWKRWLFTSGTLKSCNMLFEQTNILTEAVLFCWISVIKPDQRCLALNLKIFPMLTCILTLKFPCIHVLMPLVSEEMNWRWLDVWERGSGRGMVCVYTHICV